MKHSDEENTLSPNAISHCSEDEKIKENMAFSTMDDKDAVYLRLANS